MIDTNIWVYAADPAEPAKRAVARQLIVALTAADEVVVSVHTASRINCTYQPATEVAAETSHRPAVLRDFRRAGAPDRALALDPSRSQAAKAAIVKWQPRLQPPAPMR